MLLVKNHLIGGKLLGVGFKLISCCKILTWVSVGGVKIIICNIFLSIEIMKHFNCLKTADFSYFVKVIQKIAILFSINLECILWHLHNNGESFYLIIYL